MEATMLQFLQGNEAVADDGDILPFFGGPGTPLTSTAPSGKGTERHRVDVVTIVAPDGTHILIIMTSSPFVEVCRVPHASRWFASAATHVWCAMHAFLRVHILVQRWW